MAFQHRESLGDLISAESLVTVTHAALAQFQAIVFQGKEDSRAPLARQYREDAEKALQGLAASGAQDSVTSGISQVRAALNSWEE